MTEGEGAIEEALRTLNELERDIDWLRAERVKMMDASAKRTQIDGEALAAALAAKETAEARAAGLKELNDLLQQANGELSARCIAEERRAETAERERDESEKERERLRELLQEVSDGPTFGPVALMDRIDQALSPDSQEKRAGS